MDDVPHIGLPISVIGDRTYATVQQDTNDEVACCVAAILGFPLGFREDDPDFGITDPTFATRPIDTEEIEQAVETYETRAQLRITESAVDGRDPFSASLSVEVHVFLSEDE